LRDASLDGLRRLLGLEKDEAETAVFKERARAFLVDNERGKAISIRLADRQYAAGVSGPNGHFQATVRLSAHDVRELERVRDTDDGWLRFEAVTRKEDARVFPGRVLLIDRTGLSVISDIDDTIKISEVADRKALLRNTFLRGFEAVAGMPKLYRSWAKAGARFHYVSASPWQLCGAPLLRGPGQRNRHPVEQAWHLGPRRRRRHPPGGRGHPTLPGRYRGRIRQSAARRQIQQGGARSASLTHRSPRPSHQAQEHPQLSCTLTPSRL